MGCSCADSTEGFSDGVFFLFFSFLFFSDLSGIGCVVFFFNLFFLSEDTQIFFVCFCFVFVKFPEAMAGISCHKQHS